MGAEEGELDSTDLERSFLSSLEGRAFTEHLAPHEPIYFLYGSKAPAAKFQFSFKYKLIDCLQTNESKESSNLLRSLNFAYTQRSLWDLDADSSPFYDTTHVPELIFEASRSTSSKGQSIMRPMGFQIALKHESNGRAEEGSRGFTATYFKPVYVLGRLDSWHATIAPEVFFYLQDSSNNSDISDYRGHYQIRGAISKKDGLSVNYMVGSGKDFKRITYQLDLTIPLHVKPVDFAMYFQTQYFNGYGESLLSYNERTNGLRFGISFMR